jgi:glutamate N-acetyltransferase/amino-acid N-acetyltransferase
MAELHLLSPKGFRGGGVYAGIKQRQTNDVGLLVCETRATAAAAFTTNRVFAAPIAVGREHIADGFLRGVVINSGNANACTGKQGLRDARDMCRLAAAKIHCDPTDVLPSSTGIIGHHLPMEKVSRGIVEASLAMGDSSEHALAFTESILTTDTRRKFAAGRVKIGRETITIAGICKGAGMIGPRMRVEAGGKPAGRKLRGRHATMLSYITTDAAIAPAVLRKALGLAVDTSFNCVTIDDHTSTNDTAVVLASGLGGKIASADLPKFAAALRQVCEDLAYQIAADGEGATKVVKVEVKGAQTPASAAVIARAIANSPLVKCAMHGNDPNWGRIVSAAGYCGASFDPDKAVLVVEGTTLFRKGQPLPFDAKDASAQLKTGEVTVNLACGLGKASATVYGCDLSKEYVSINADYTT